MEGKVGEERKKVRKRDKQHSVELDGDCFGVFEVGEVVGCGCGCDGDVAGWWEWWR